MYDKTQDKNTIKMFVVTISNAKNIYEMKFHIDDPMLKYCQGISDGCCFSSL